MRSITESALWQPRILRPLWKLCALAVIAAVLFIGIVNGIKNPVDGNTRGYTAEFTDVSGLHPNADVRVRGVKVGKVSSVDLQRHGDGMVADVGFTLTTGHRITSATKAAVKYANLSGVRYVDLTDIDGPGERISRIAVENTTPSFDITQLFNGLQPELENLSPSEINVFSENALAVAQGDGRGLAPLLRGVDRLSGYASDRQRVISVLVQNLSRISDSLGGKSPEILEFIRTLQAPVDAALSVLGEIRKAAAYGPSFAGYVNKILAGLGIEQDTDVDRILSSAFPNVDSLWQGLDRMPSLIDGLTKPVQLPKADRGCPHGAAPMPAMAKVLINGSEVIMCRG